MTITENQSMLEIPQRKRTEEEISVLRQVASTATHYSEGIGELVYTIVMVGRTGITVRANELSVAQVINFEDMKPNNSKFYKTNIVEISFREEVDIDEVIKSLQRDSSATLGAPTPQQVGLPAAAAKDTAKVDDKIAAIHAMVDVITNCSKHIETNSNGATAVVVRLKSFPKALASAFYDLACAYQVSVRHEVGHRDHVTQFEIAVASSDLDAATQEALLSVDTLVSAEWVAAALQPFVEVEHFVNLTSKVLVALSDLKNRRIAQLRSGST